MDENASMLSIGDEMKNRFGKIIRDLAAAYLPLSRFFESLMNSMSGIFEAMQSVLFLNRIDVLRYQLPAGRSGMKAKRSFFPRRKVVASRIPQASLPFLLHLNINSKIASNLSEVLTSEVPVVPSDEADVEGEGGDEAATGFAEAQSQVSGRTGGALGKQPPLKFSEARKTSLKTPLLAAPISMAYMVSGISTPQTIQFNAQSMEAIAYARQLPQLVVSNPKGAIQIPSEFGIGAKGASLPPQGMAVQSPIVPIIGTMLALQMYSYLASGISSILPQATQGFSTGSLGSVAQATIPLRGTLGSGAWHRTLTTQTGGGIGDASISLGNLTSPGEFGSISPEIPEGLKAFMPWLSSASSFTPWLSSASSFGTSLSNLVPQTMSMSYGNLLQGLPLSKVTGTIKKALPTFLKGAVPFSSSLQTLMLTSIIGKDTFSRWSGSSIVGKRGSIIELEEALSPSATQKQILSIKAMQSSILSRLPQFVRFPFTPGTGKMAIPVVGAAMVSFLGRHLSLPSITGLKGVPRTISDAINGYGGVLSGSANLTFGDSLSRLGMPVISEQTAEFQPLPEEPYFKMPPLEEPRVYGSASQPMVNVEVTAGSEHELRDLERKISKIIEDQMRRHYGLG